MGIDWFTVIAQIINFLLLVALLKRFLYGPIVRAMDRREAEIASRLDVASEKTAEAEKERVRYEGLAGELAGNRDEMLANARDEVTALRQELLENARKEANRNRLQWQESFCRERESFLQSLRCHVSREVCAVVRLVVTEMADASLQERMAICLERRILSLEDAERVTLAAQFLSPGQEIIVKSAFEMNPETRRTVSRMLHGLALLGVETGNFFSRGTPLHRLPDEADMAEGRGVRFEVDPSLVCGIEMRSGGRSLAWNLEDYLDEMEQHLLAAIGKVPVGDETEISL
jgi:F-type H+-transporting ATPase subunit b